MPGQRGCDGLGRREGPRARERGPLRLFALDRLPTAAHKIRRAPTSRLYPGCMPRPKTHDDLLRAKLLDRAGELLADEGAQGLSLRRLASEVGTSTTAVYSLFGSKPALLARLCAEGFRAIGDRLREVRLTGDAVNDLVHLGTAYRDTALAQRNLYVLMFAGGDSTSPGTAGEVREELQLVLEPLHEAARSGVAAGVFDDVPGDVIASSVWAYAHGMVCFELHRTLPSGFEYPRTYEQGLHAIVLGWCR